MDRLDILPDERRLIWMTYAENFGLSNERWAVSVEPVVTDRRWPMRLLSRDPEG